LCRARETSSDRPPHRARRSSVARTSAHHSRSHHPAGGRRILRSPSRTDRARVDPRSRAALSRSAGVCLLRYRFHRTLPEAAARFALPETLWNAGIRRYGFHGLSCESVLHALGQAAGPRIIVAHLGNGASITAIANGLSVDTTMGLTPTGGIIM